MATRGAESGHIEVSESEAVAVVTLRRPDQLNVLTADMRRELAAILRYYGDGHLVRGIVVTGTGRAFSAGLDLKEAAGLPPGGLLADVELFHDITRAALQTRIPVVAALNGIAVGGACEMTLCFDARIGTPAAEYFLPEQPRADHLQRVQRSAAPAGRRASAAPGPGVGPDRGPGRASHGPAGRTTAPIPIRIPPTTSGPDLTWGQLPAGWLSVTSS